MGRAIAVLLFAGGLAAVVWGFLVGFDVVGLPSEREVAVAALVGFGMALMSGVDLK